MKKTFFAVALMAVMAGGMISCSNTNYCWEITTTTTIIGVETQAVTYYWGTKSEAETHVSTLQKAASLLGGTVTKAKSSKSETDCKN